MHGLSYTSSFNSMCYKYYDYKSVPVVHGWQVLLRCSISVSLYPPREPRAEREPESREERVRAATVLCTHTGLHVLYQARRYRLFRPVT